MIRVDKTHRQDDGVIPFHTHAPSLYKSLLYVTIILPA